jgi:hypothetical protein
MQIGMVLGVGFLLLAFGLVLVLRPSFYLNLKSVRETYNPKLLGSGYFRLQMRTLGVVFTLFACAFLVSIVHKGFEQTLFAVLMVVFWIVWIGFLLIWIAEKVRIIRPSLKERYDAITAEEDARRQEKETLFFAGSLVALLVAAGVLTVFR